MKLEKIKSTGNKTVMFLKNFIKSFVIWGLLTFIILTINGVVVHYNNIFVRECKKFESKYGIEKDAVKLMHLSTIRTKTLRYIFSNSSILSSYIKNKELKYYEKIKNKLPPDDLMIDYMDYNMYYFPGIISDKHTREFDESLIVFLKKIKGKISVIEGLNKETKVEFITTIVGHIAWGFYKKDNKVLNFLEQYLLNLMSAYNYPKADENYRRFLLTATLVLINKRQSFNSKPDLDITICSDYMYIKWKNRVLEAYSYIEKIQYRNEGYFRDIINDIKEEKDELDEIEKNYCQKGALLQH